MKLILGATCMMILLVLLAACLPLTTPPPPLPTETSTPTETATPTFVWFPPTPTYTMFPTPSAIGTPTAVVGPEHGALLFSDDFNDPDLWTLGRSQAGSTALGGAYDVLTDTNLLPAICGRVCPQENQCEGVCTAGDTLEPVAVGRLERWVGDQAIAEGWANIPYIEPVPYRIGIVGSGPAGMACAADMAKAGCDVTVYEAFHQPGGVLRYGIPDFRLPNEVIDAEIGKLKQLGVKFECNTLVARLFTIEQMIDELGFHAVFVGTGAGYPTMLGIPGDSLNGVLSVTGDGSRTAVAIARQIGLIKEKPVVIEGHAFNQMSDGELREKLLGKEVLFARMTPKDKLRVGSILKEEGEIVAVTGDGVNDAPALKKADIGLAMGISGTDVAKEASDMILLDDNFATIVNAVEEGRTVYENIKKFMTYIFASNIPEAVPYLAYILLRIPLPLTIIQILAVDLGTDMLPALALAPSPGRMAGMSKSCWS